ncbi:MAG: trehalose-phosphatase [Acidimicrobiia bacterium]
MRPPELAKLVAICAMDAPVLVVEDYDGTLAPIVDDPARAVPHPRALGTLANLTEVAKVAIISGRPADFVVTQIGTLSLSIDVVGMYGRQIARDGLVITHPDAERDRDNIALALARAVDQLQPLGVDIEDKDGLGVGLHVRKVAAQAHGAFGVASDWATEVGNELGLRVELGRQVVELTGAADFDKGNALLDLVEIEAPGAVVVMGDDRGDIPAFAAVRRLRDVGTTAYGIAVDSSELDPQVRAAADIVIPSIDAGLDFLDRLDHELRGLRRARNVGIGLA